MLASAVACVASVALSGGCSWTDSWTDRPQWTVRADLPCGPRDRVIATTDTHTRSRRLGHLAITAVVVVVGEQRVAELCALCWPRFLEG